MVTFGARTLNARPRTHVKPRFRKINTDLAPFELYNKIHNCFDHSYILESVEGPEKLAEYSFIGFEPYKIVQIKNDVVEIKDQVSGEKETVKASNPLGIIKSIVDEGMVDEKRFRLIGGAVGYVSYDAIRYFEDLPTSAEDDIQYPDLEFAFYRDGVVFDHKNHLVYYYHMGEDRFKYLEEVLQGSADSSFFNYHITGYNISGRKYQVMVTNAKDYISSGDIFQVVLSRRLDLKVEGELLQFYKALRRINPSPYMYYLKMGDRQIVGSSPEMLVRVDGMTVETFPIAGTRPILPDKLESCRLSEELLRDPKDRAEHIMLVDLARNDVGRVAEYGTVHTPEFMTVHRFSHVQHIVSRVIGTLSKQYSCYDALASVFPAGTVSGAPKVRAMEIIEELEPTRRGPYAGAVGYFSFNGNADFAITIRTLTSNCNRASIQVGAGIVADSNPEMELHETEHKAQALIEGLKYARRQVQ